MVLAGVNVFGDAHQVESVQFGDRRPPENGSTTDEECTLPALASALDRMIEQILFVRNSGADAEGPLKNILVVEVVRSLDETHFWICEKWDGLRQKCRHRNMVCVEHNDQLAIGLRQGVVQVAGFRMLTRAFDVGGPEPFSQSADFFSMAVIQYKNKV